MPGVFGKFVTITPKANAWDDGEKVLTYALDNIAQDVQSRLRSRIDVGIDAKASLRARSITVRNDEGQLVIRSQETDDEEATSVHDLFRSQNTPPYIQGNKLVFRELREDAIAKKNEDAVRHSIEDSIRLNLVRHIDDGIRRTVSENPTLISGNPTLK